MTALPIREIAVRHRCLCDTGGGGRGDRCVRLVDDPDAPYCPECENQPGHANNPPPEAPF